MIIAHFHVARQLASPRGGHPTPRRGGLILRSICTYMNEIHLFRTILARFSLLTAGRFSRSQLRCTQRSRMYSRGKLGPWSCSAARALGVTIISSWQVLTALRSASPSVAGQWKPNKFTVSALLVLHDIICISQCASSSEALCLVAATIQQQSHNKLVSLCDGHGRFICCVGVFAPCFLSTQGIGTNALSHEG